MENLQNKIAVVTGAASGMGLAFAHRFARAGMKVVMSDIESPPLDLAVTPVINEWRGMRSAEFRLVDMRAAAT